MTPMRRTAVVLTAVLFLPAVGVAAVGTPVLVPVATTSDGVVTVDDLERWRVCRPSGSRARLEVSLQDEIEAITVQRVLASRAPSDPDQPDWGCRNRRSILDAGAAARVLERVVSEASVPSSAAVRAAYVANLDHYRRPKRWRLFNIFLRLPEAAPPDLRTRIAERAAELRLRAVSGEDFSKLARAESESPTAIRGGRIGNVSSAFFPPEIAAMVERLEPGEISDVIVTDDGFTILYCADILAAETLTLAEVEALISGQLKKETFDSAWQSLTTGTLDRTKWVTHLGAAARGTDDDVVLENPTGGATLRIDRSTYLWWARNRGSGDPNTWTESRHRTALDELALTFDLASEADRRWLTAGTKPDECRVLDVQHVTAECVLDHEIGLRLRPVTTREIAAFFAANGASITDPEWLDLELLRVALTPAVPPDVYRTLSRSATRIRAGEADLQTTAAELTDHGLDARLESFHRVTRTGAGSLGRAIGVAVTDLDQGGVSDPVQEGRELVLIRCATVTPPRPLTIEESSPLIRRRLEKQQRRRLRQQIEAEILAEQDIRIH